MVIALKGAKNMHMKNYLIAVTAVVILFAVCIGPAAAYSNYEYIWSSSGNQLIEEGWNNPSHITYGPYHVANTYYFTLKSGTGATLLTPFVNSGNKNGVRPKVRYLWFPMNMPTGVHVTAVDIYNGNSKMYSNSDLNWQGLGADKEYLLDMGSFKDVNRGINVAFLFQNDGATDQTVQTYGGGAREEW
jgi:hypothetical protein